jgi:hypothetical protein
VKASDHKLYSSSVTTTQQYKLHKQGSEAARQEVRLILKFPISFKLEKKIIRNSSLEESYVNIREESMCDFLLSYGSSEDLNFHVKEIKNQSSKT